MLMALPLTFRGFTLFLFVGLTAGKLIKKNGNQIRQTLHATPPLPAVALLSA